MQVALTHDEWYKLGCRHGKLRDRLFEMSALICNRYGKSDPRWRRFFALFECFSVEVSSDLDEIVCKRAICPGEFLDLSFTAPEYEGKISPARLFYSIGRRSEFAKLPPRSRPLPKTLEDKDYREMISVLQDTRYFMDEVSPMLSVKMKSKISKLIINAKIQPSVQ